MSKIFIYLFILSAFATLPLYAQTAKSLDAISIEGETRIQRSDRKNWQLLGIGDKVNDNDIIETFFQTKLVLSFGNGNVVILGSNSKALINISERAGLTGKITDVSITVFGGGAFAKAVSQANISIYTSNGVAVTQNGSVSTVVESKTQETGFQILGGSVNVRSISQKEGKDLQAGQTTMIFAGKEPSAPLYITYRHVAVLKHFFGDEYITNELNVSGIKPTEDRLSRDRLSLSQDARARAGLQKVDEGIDRVVFNLDRIYGSILDDLKKQSHWYFPIRRPLFALPDRLVAAASFDIAAAAGSAAPALALCVNYQLVPQLDVGIRLPLAANYTGQMGLYGFTAVNGLLDKIERVTLRPVAPGFPELRLGAITDITLGSGLMVSRFSALNRYALFTPLSLQAGGTWDIISARGFVADVADFSVGGIALSIDPLNYHFGIGYYYDANQYATVLPAENNRFVQLSTLKPDSVVVRLTDTTVSTMALTPATVHVYELDMGVDLMYTSDFKLRMGAAFAQKIGNMHMEGFVARMPGFDAELQGHQFGISLIGEVGKLVADQFHPFYMSNRARVIIHPTRKDTVITQNGMLSENRNSGAIALYYRVNPIHGTAIEIAYKQNIYDNYALTTDTAYSSPDISYEISISADERLIPKIKYINLRMRQIHGGLFPPQPGLFGWGYDFGLEALSQPLFLNIAAQLAFNYYLIDISRPIDNTLGAGDGAFEFNAGIVWGL